MPTYEHDHEQLTHTYEGGMGKGNLSIHARDFHLKRNSRFLSSQTTLSGFEAFGLLTKI